MTRRCCGYDGVTDLDGQHALVTGGGTGIGAAIAVALADAGAIVTISGRTSRSLDAVAARHRRISPAVADVTDGRAIADLFDRLAGDGRAPTIVVANAGAADSAPFAQTDMDVWQAMLSVNLTGVFSTFKAAAPRMTENGSGRLIAISSTAGLKGYPYVTAYCAAKHGVVGLVRALALELAHSGVTVNAVCPGFAETPLLERSIETITKKTGQARDTALRSLTAANPLGRLIQPREIADAVLWLCGPDAGAITGQALSVSGGEV